ncbi:hypothetical protein FH610_011030 [Microbispora catharanthi]|uniref:Uncharacterized protein n=1 Tax=Microbispora catharanthi TaxID=1712871 RepID=A0A5N6BXZ0_9ACTN|nr:hypothetical protein FH610_011030 [Microbispora catharanthi]
MINSAHVTSWAWFSGGGGDAHRRRHGLFKRGLHEGVQRRERVHRTRVGVLPRFARRAAGQRERGGAERDADRHRCRRTRRRGRRPERRRGR